MPETDHRLALDSMSEAIVGKLIPALGGRTFSVVRKPILVAVPNTRAIVGWTRSRLPGNRLTETVNKTA